jgi:hypothetical protein
MVDAKMESPQQATLKRLLQIEAEAQNRRQQAQTRAKEMQTAGAAAVEQLLADARTNAQAEADRRNQQMQSEVKAEIERLAAANQRQIDKLRANAQSNMAGAVRWVVDWVIGKEAEI